MKKANLPEWASVICKGKINVDADGMYKDWLDRLGIIDNDIDQYWLELAKICAGLELKFSVAGTDAACDEGGALVMIINDESKTEGKWVQANYPEGKGEKAAAKDSREKFRNIMNINI